MATVLDAPSSGVVIGQTFYALTDNRELFKNPLPKAAPSQDVVDLQETADAADRLWGARRDPARAAVASALQPRHDSALAEYRGLLRDVVAGKDVDGDRLNALRMALHKSVERVLLDVDLVISFDKYAENRAMYRNLIPVVRAATGRLESIRSKYRTKLRPVSMGDGLRRAKVDNEYLPQIQQAKVDLEGLQALQKQLIGHCDMHACQQHLGVEYHEDAAVTAAPQAVSKRGRVTK